MVNSLLVGCGQRIVWVLAQAIRATSLMSGVSCSSKADGHARRKHLRTNTARSSVRGRGLVLTGKLIDCALTAVSLARQDQRSTNGDEELLKPLDASKDSPTKRPPKGGLRCRSQDKISAKVSRYTASIICCTASSKLNSPRMTRFCRARSSAVGVQPSNATIAFALRKAALRLS